MQSHPHELIWVAPEYEFREKGVSWYWASICIAILILAFAVWQKNYLFAVFIVIAEMLMLVWGSEEPRLVKFTLNAKRLEIGIGRVYPLSDIDHFSVEDLDHKEWASVVVRSKHVFKFPVRIHVPKHHLADAQAILSGAGVEERHHEETLLETLEEFLGF